MLLVFDMWSFGPRKPGTILSAAFNIQLEDGHITGYDEPQYTWEIHILTYHFLGQIQ